MYMSRSLYTNTFIISKVREYIYSHIVQHYRYKQTTLSQKEILDSMTDTMYSGCLSPDPDIDD